ncbi:hypothetical protein HK405_010934, partial [Cladochytrium tenue]
AMKAIVPYISEKVPGFEVTEAFVQSLYYLGGVPRLLTIFATKLSSMTAEDIDDDCLRETRVK